MLLRALPLGRTRIGEIDSTKPDLGDVCCPDSAPSRGALLVNSYKRQCVMRSLVHLKLALVQAALEIPVIQVPFKHDKDVRQELGHGGTERFA